MGKLRRGRGSYEDGEADGGAEDEKEEEGERDCFDYGEGMAEAVHCDEAGGSGLAWRRGRFGEKGVPRYSFGARHQTGGL